VTRAAQLARGTATAAVAVVLAACSHGIAGREAPGMVGLALAAVVAVGASVAFIGRRSTPLRTALAVIVSQAAFHLLFSVGAPGGGGGSTLDVTGSGHHHPLDSVEGAAAIAGQGPGQGLGHPGHADAAMLVGHTIAAALTIAYLLVLERAVWLALGAATRRLVLRLTTTTEPVGVACVVPAPLVGTTPTRLHGRLAFTAVRYRGPPFALASA
jgi:hypothetical protein